MSGIFLASEAAMSSLPGHTMWQRRDTNPPTLAVKSKNPLTLQTQALAPGDATSIRSHRGFSNLAESHPVPMAYTSEPC